MHSHPRPPSSRWWPLAHAPTDADTPAARTAFMPQTGSDYGGVYDKLIVVMKEVVIVLVLTMVVGSGDGRRYNTVGV